MTCATSTCVTTTASNTATPSIDFLTNQTSLTPAVPALSHGQKINQAADALLTPNTLSLREHQSPNFVPPSASSVINTNNSTDNATDNKKRPYLPSSVVEPVAKKNESFENELVGSRRDVIRGSYENTNSLPNSTDYNKPAMLNSRKNDTANSRTSNERQPHGINSMFEPVSPISDEVSKSPKSPKEEPTGKISEERIASHRRLLISKSQ